MISNLLFAWLDSAQVELLAMGYRCRRRAEVDYTTATSIDLDGSAFVGGVCHWPPSTFEFLFLDGTTGDVLVLETVDLPDRDSLATFVEGLLLRLPIAESG